VAQLQFDTQRNYLQTLADLGWMDEGGNFVPGLLETEAVRRRGDLNFEREGAIRNVTEGAMRGGTVFSGRRAFNQSQAQRPYDAALANLETTLGRELGTRYSNLGDLTRQFELSRNQLIAEAVQRYQQSLLGGPAGMQNFGDTSEHGRLPSDAEDDALLQQQNDPWANLQNMSQAQGNAIASAINPAQIRNVLALMAQEAQKKKGGSKKK
jgi:hypothetical protein